MPVTLATAYLPAPASAEPSPPLPVPADSVEPPFGSQVFPEGDFPDVRPAPESELPARMRRPGYVPVLQPQGSDYPARDYEAVQDAPGG